mmetsp:Transcript_128931/g.334260  ORF Transcript_128931/g.334260 Transcript_128931/m.334260 type:complete len:290 (+) Transcript_128931:73-942(+)
MASLPISFSLSYGDDDHYDGDVNGRFQIEDEYEDEDEIIDLFLAKISGPGVGNPISDDYCSKQNDDFGDLSNFAAKGAVREMGATPDDHMDDDVYDDGHSVCSAEYRHYLNGYDDEEGIDDGGYCDEDDDDYIYGSGLSSMDGEGEVLWESYDFDEEEEEAYFHEFGDHDDNDDYNLSFALGMQSIYDETKEEEEELAHWLERDPQGFAVDDQGPLVQEQRGFDVPEVSGVFAGQVIGYQEEKKEKRNEEVEGKKEKRRLRRQKHRRRRKEVKEVEGKKTAIPCTTQAT